MIYLVLTLLACSLVSTSAAAVDTTDLWFKMRSDSEVVATDIPAPSAAAVTDLHDCAAFCKANSACEGFFYENGACEVFGNVTDVIEGSRKPYLTEGVMM